MSRVNVSWIIAVLAVELATLSAARAHSCHEVKTAFQVRQIGQLKWVPETPATGECERNGLSFVMTVTKLYCGCSCFGCSSLLHLLVL